MIRLLAVTVMGMIDIAAAFALGGVFGGLVVAIAAGWACAQYDTNYQRARAARNGPPSATPRPERHDRLEK